MKSNKVRFASIDEYILAFPKERQNIMEELRAAIKAAVPEAEGKIAYKMPTFALNGNLVLFAAWKNHIGFYPTPSGMEAFKEELSSYKRAKGSVQFPINQPLPLPLIRRIVEYRVKENSERKPRKKSTGKKEK